MPQEQNILGWSQILRCQGAHTKQKLKVICQRQQLLSLLIVCALWTLCVCHRGKSK